MKRAEFVVFCLRCGRRLLTIEAFGPSRAEWGDRVADAYGQVVD